MSNKFVAYLNWVVFVLLCGISNNYMKFMVFFYRLQERSERGGHGRMFPPPVNTYCHYKQGKRCLKVVKRRHKVMMVRGLYREGGSTARGKRSPLPWSRVPSDIEKVVCRPSGGPNPIDSSFVDPRPPPHFFDKSDTDDTDLTQARLVMAAACEGSQALSAKVE